MKLVLRRRQAIINYYKLVSKSNTPETTRYGEFFVAFLLKLDGMFAATDYRLRQMKHSMKRELCKSQKIAPIS